MTQTSYGTITITDTTDLEWFYGTGVLNGTGDSVNHQIVLTSNLINGAAVGSMYLDTQTSLVYKCIEISDSSQTWQYVGNMTAGVQDEIEDASKVATNYLAVDETGIMVANMEENEYTPTSIINTNVNNVFIDSDSVDIRKGGNVLATFGSITTIGENNKPRIELSSNSMVGYGGTNKKEFFKFAGDGGALTNFLRSESMHQYPVQFLLPPNQPKSYTLNYFPNSAKSLKLSIHFFHRGTYANLFRREYLDGEAMSSIDTILIEPNQDGDFNYIARFYFFAGTVNDNNWIGFSGNGATNNQATIEYKLSLTYSKTTGTFTNIKVEETSNSIEFESQSRPNAEVSLYAHYYSLEATPVFSFGDDNVISGGYSTVNGIGLKSNYFNQYIFGQYNANNSENILEIGNGLDDSNRSNLFTIDRQGNVIIASNVTAYNQKLIYVSGDVISQTGYIECAGRIAASGKTLAFQIPLVKPIASGCTLTLDTTNTLLAIYYYNGNISEAAISSISGITSTNLSNISLTYSDCGIRVTIPKSTNWISSINQTNVTVVLHNLSITVS